MAIQMRRGLRKDFDPNKMLPGEWAVSIDATTSNQIVWMCFAAGVCKRMGTYEDFQSMVNEISADIIAQYKAEFNVILSEVQALSDAVESDKDSVATMHTQIRDEYLPQIANAYEYALLSKSYAVGGSGVREGEDSDNAKYYYQQTKQISQGINGIVPMGTVAFADLPTEDIVKNAMYNVSDAFTSDERFNDGGGIYYGPGNNVIWTAEGKWDVTASSNVTGIKGDAEKTYRQGNVNITAENIGLGNVDNTSDTNKPISTAQQTAFDEIRSIIGKIGAIYHTAPSSNVTLNEDTSVELCKIEIPAGTYLAIGKVGFSATFTSVYVMWKYENGSEQTLVYEINISEKAVTLEKAISFAYPTTLILKARGNGIVTVDNRLNFLQAIRLK